MTSSSTKISGGVKTFYDTFKTYCKAMVDAADDDGKEKTAGAKLWTTLKKSKTDEDAE